MLPKRFNDWRIQAMCRCCGATYFRHRRERGAAEFYCLTCRHWDSVGASLLNARLVRELTK